MHRPGKARGVLDAGGSDFVLGAALCGSLVVAYFPALHGGFIWDDDAHVTENPHVLGARAWAEIWTTRAANYFPLVLTCFRLQHALWGLDPFRFHLVTLACHGVAALLLWRVLRQLGITRTGAWMGAALWALHPVQAESVAWISELKNTLSAVFFLLAASFHLAWVQRDRAGGPTGGSVDAPATVRGIAGYVLALLSAVLALLSKPSTVMLPVVLGLCLWWRWGVVRGRDVIALAPFVLLSGAASGWTIWEQAFHSGARGPEWAHGFPERLAIAGRAVWFYLGKLAWPESLTFIYPRWDPGAGGFGAWLPALAAGLGLVALGRWGGGGRRPLLLAAGCFLTLLFPVLGFFNVYFFRYSFVGDHFQYLASIGPLALAGALLMRLPRRAAIVPAVLLLSGLTLLTRQHAATFVNNETLWRATLGRNPQAAMAWLNLGTTLARQGRDDEAMHCFERAAALRIQDPDTQNDAGWGLLDVGLAGPAVKFFERALHLDPDHAGAHQNLGNALRRLGRREEAIGHYVRARELQPGSAEAHNNLGSALAEAGRLPEAIGEFTAAVQRSPGFAPAHANLGTALGLAERWPEAVAALRESLRLQPDYPDAHGKLGVALANAGRLDEAVAPLEHALRLDSSAPGLHRNLAQVLHTLGREREAAALLARAAELERRP